MIKICESTYEQYKHYTDAKSKKAKTARFNKILKLKGVKNIYCILDNILMLKNVDFAGEQLLLIRMM